MYTRSIEIYYLIHISILKMNRVLINFFKSNNLKYYVIVLTMSSFSYFFFLFFVIFLQVPKETRIITCFIGN